VRGVIDQPPLSTKPPRRDWLRWGLAAFLLASCGLFVDFREAFAAVAGVAPAWIAAILALMTFDRLVMPWKWSILLRAVGLRVPLGRLIRYYYQGSLTGIFLPSSVGGDVLRAHLVARWTGAGPEIYASLLMEKAIGVLSAVNWALIGTAGLLFMRDGRVSFTWGVVVLGLTAHVGVFLLSVNPRVHTLVSSRLGGLRASRPTNFLMQALTAYASFSQCRRALLWNGLATMGEHALQVLVVFLVGRSLGISVPALSFLCVSTLHAFVQRLPIAPDGWGVAELSAIGLYGLLGVPPERAFDLSFLQHVFQLVTALPGLWFTLFARARAKSEGDSPTRRERDPVTTA
jgi:glycosyltransferase 2 family protein